MKSKFFLIVNCLYFVVISTVISQNSSAGTEFHFALIQNRIDKNCAPTSSLLEQAEIFVYVNNNSNSIAEVSIDFSGENVNYEINGVLYLTGAASNLHLFSLDADETCVIRCVPNDSVTYDNVSPGEGYETVPDYRNIQLTNNCAIQEKVFVVKSINETLITVFVESTQGAGRDVAMVLPKESLGVEYYAFTYDPSPLEYPTSHYGGNFGGPAEIAIVAVEDSTTIFFKLPVSMTESDYAYSNIDSNNCVTYNGEVIHEILLNEGEAFQIQSDNYDLTGTHLWSVNSFAVFSGNMATRVNCTTIPTECGSDYIFEQMFHRKNWAENFVVPNINNAVDDIVRIIATVNGTEVYINGNLEYNLNSGEFAEFVNNSLEPIRVKSVPHPISIALYGKSSQVIGSYHQKRDPSLTVVAPLNQGVQEISFSVLPESGFTGFCTDNVKEDYLYIVAASTEKSLVYIEDFINPPMAVEEMIGSIVVPWTALTADTNVSYCIIDVSNNSNIQATTYKLFMNQINTYGFNAYVFGLDCTEGYGYCTGLSIELDSTTNITNNYESELIVFPNPVDDQLNIKFTDKNDQEIFVSILDIGGREIINEVFEPTDNIIINTKSFITGSYFVIIDRGKRFVRKIQVK
ncbi:MAG: T9SS type A sorting domain-containing protein [Bacteroidales bacterium]|nr:T9SS type A sorting domain-containing protein [Bacteroidales bacterium]